MNKINKFPYHDLMYKTNPDQHTNPHGRALTNILENCVTMKIVNGDIKDGKTCESNFTYFSGNKKSQNDWCITNNLDIITNFLNKMSISNKKYVL